MQSSVRERLNWTPGGKQPGGGRDTTPEGTQTGEAEAQATSGIRVWTSWCCRICFQENCKA